MKEYIMASKKKKTAKKAAKRTAKKTAKKTAKRTAKKVAKKVAKKAAKKTAKRTAKKVAKKVAKKTAKKTAKRTAKKVAKKVAKKTAKKTAKRTAKKVAKKVAKRTAKKTAETAAASPRKAPKKRTRRTSAPPTPAQVKALTQLARSTVTAVSKVGGPMLGSLSKKGLAKKDPETGLWEITSKGSEYVSVETADKAPKRAAKRTAKKAAKRTAKKAAPKRSATRSAPKAAPKKRRSAKKKYTPVKERRAQGKRVKDTTLAACVMGSRSPAATDPRRVNEMKSSRAACGPGAPTPSRAAAIMGQVGGKAAARARRAEARMSANPGFGYADRDRSMNPAEVQRIKNRLLNPDAYTS